MWVICSYSFFILVFFIFVVSVVFFPVHLHIFIIGSLEFFEFGYLYQWCLNIILALIWIVFFTMFVWYAVVYVYSGLCFFCSLFSLVFFNAFSSIWWYVFYNVCLLRCGVGYFRIVMILCCLRCAFLLASFTLVSFFVGCLLFFLLVFAVVSLFTVVSVILCLFYDALLCRAVFIRMVLFNTLY